jgi:ABC-type transport system involved in multi-copper enzyme maturation permease subunit
MGWRRRGLVVVVGAFTIAFVALLVGIQRLEGAPREVVSDFMNAMSYGVFPALWQLIAGVPLVAAETFAYDHRTQTKELLGDLPVGNATYLTGKVLGVCVVVLGSLIASAFFIGGVGWLLYGAYDVRAYLLLWGYTIVPMTLFAAALGTLLAVGCTTRRQAIMAGMLSIPYAAGISIFGLIFAGFASENIVQTMLFLLANVAVVWLLAWGWMRGREGRA